MVRILELTGILEQKAALARVYAGYGGLMMKPGFGISRK